MKTKYLLIIILTTTFAFSCTKHQVCENYGKIDTNTISKKVQLAEFLYKSGNIITHKQCPYLVHASDLFYNKKDFLLIDIRDSSEYDKGHIDGAYNVERSELMSFLRDSINPAAYKKIAIIDKNGPMAEYVAMLLRFDGYNAYGLKFGIGSWNVSLESNISTYLSNKYANKTDTIKVKKPKHGQIPDLSSENIVNLLDKRVGELVAEPEDSIIIPMDKYFGNLNDYFTIAYWSAEKYNQSHIKGSVRYNTRSDLSLDKDLNTLPRDKKIMVYCNTGHHAIAVVAYLRLLGYKASSLMYGANSFMNKKFKTFAPGAAIIDARVLCGDFPLIKGKDRTSKVSSAVVPASTNTAPPVPIVKRKKTAVNVGGCE